MKTFQDILNENQEPVSDEDLKPGFQFFVVSKNGRSLSRFKITGQQEMNVGTVYKVKHAVLAGDKFKQDFIAKDYVLGRAGGLKVFRKRKPAMAAFKRASFSEKVRIVKPGEIAKDSDGRPIRPGDIVTHPKFGKGQIEMIDTKTYSFPMVSVELHSGKFKGEKIARAANEWTKRG
jgi:hypothetical protein